MIEYNILPIILYTIAIYYLSVLPSRIMVKSDNTHLFKLNFGVFQSHSKQQILIHSRQISLISIEYALPQRHSFQPLSHQVALG